jgi:hypothetical protein
MKLSLIASLLIAACLAVYAQSASPSATSADPLNGKRGDVITITGTNLGKNLVAKVYLTDDKNDLQAEVTEQTATTIKFKIPAKATGKLSVMFLTTEKEPKYIVQPVKVTVDEQ